MDVSKISVPETLKEKWNEVKKDGVISNNDYNQLIKAAAPNNKDEELSVSELNFLVKLKSSLETSSNGNGVAVKELKFLNEEEEEY